jgi:hypothetical protein
MLKRSLALLGCLFCTGSLLAASFSSAADPGTFHGRTLIQSYDEHRILIAIDTRGSGRADHYFRFWSEESLPVVDVRFDAASLQYFGNELIVVTDDERTVYRFTVGGNQQHQFRLAENATATGYTGYGLNHEMPSSAPRNAAKTSDGSARPDPSLSCDFGECEQPTWEWYGGGNCTSGGAGATSCSITISGTSCSTSCEPGYYACCTSGFGGISCTCVHK